MATVTKTVREVDGKKCLVVETAEQYGQYALEGELHSLNGQLLQLQQHRREVLAALVQLDQNYQVELDTTDLKTQLAAAAKRCGEAVQAAASLKESLAKAEADLAAMTARQEETGSELNVVKAELAAAKEKLKSK